MKRSVGKFGWGTRNREGRELVELVARNGMAIAGSFFQTRESHKITYWSGQQNRIGFGGGEKVTVVEG